MTEPADDLGDFPALEDLPDEVKSSNPDGDQIDDPDPEDDPAEGHMHPLEGDI